MKTKRRLNQLYSDYTGQPVENIERALDRDNFMSSEEALAFGLIDHVYSTRESAEAAQSS